MITVNIIGKGFLELAKDTDLSFKRDNQMFRFCDISLGRSTEFSVPDTAVNRGLLDLSEEPAQYGEAMRRRYPCQLAYGIGMMMGTIAVTSWKHGAFSCVFYSDDAEWIRSFDDRQMADIPLEPSFDTGVTWDSGSRVCDANDPSVPPIAIVKYDNGGVGGTWQLLPSVQLSKYVKQISIAIGVDIISDVDLDWHRLVMCTLNGGTSHSVDIDITGTNAATVTNGASDLSVEHITLEWATANVFGVYLGGGSTTAVGFKALRNIKVTLPDTFPSACYLVKMSTSLGRCEVIGGGASDPLASRTVELKKGEVYCFTPNGFIGVDSGGTFYGWKDVKQPLSFTVSVEDNGQMTNGDTWYLRNNQPDMTVFGFLKSVALALGCELLVSNDGIRLALTGSLGVYDVKDIIGTDEVNRGVECWGKDTQKASVVFDSEDYVIDPIVVDYGIDTTQREGVQENKCGFSEGTQGDRGVAIYDVTNDGGTPTLKARKCTIARVDSLSTWLQRIEAPYLEECDNIAINGTFVRAKILAPVSKYFGLKYDDMVQMDGQLYRWTSLQWSGGVMTMDLQRVSAFLPEPTAL